MTVAPHVIVSADPAYALLLRLAGPALGGVLALNDTRILDMAAASGVSLRVLRDSATDGMTPDDAATHLMDRDWTNIGYLQLACESGASDAWDWQLETIRILRGRGWTRGIVGGAWATGNPAGFDRTTHADGTPHFPALLPFVPVFAAVDYFALHGYVGCLPGDAAWPDAITWYACRHRLYSHCLTQHGIPVPRWLYTESGLDRVQGRTAAGRDGVTADQYAALVAALDAEDAKDGIPMRAYFTLGPTPDWAAFGWADAVPAIAAYVVSPAKTPPQSRQDDPVASATPETTVVTRIGHTMPAPLFQFTQDAGSNDCWVECIRSFFLRYGYPLPLDTVFQAGKGTARPAGGEPATFAEVKQAITTLAAQLGVTVQEADFDDPNTVAAALHDPNTANPWTVIAGVKEADLQPGQSYGHFIILDHEDSAGNVQVVDSYTNVDGNQSGRYPFAQLATAMRDNWEPLIDAIGVKITGRAA